MPCRKSQVNASSSNHPLATIDDQSSHCGSSEVHTTSPLKSMETLLARKRIRFRIACKVQLQNHVKPISSICSTSWSWIYWTPAALVIKISRTVCLSSFLWSEYLHRLGTESSHRNWTKIKFPLKFSIWNSSTIHRSIHAPHSVILFISFVVAVLTAILLLTE